MTNQNFETLDLSIQGSLALITLTRDKSLNAMNQSFFNDIHHVLDILIDRSDLKALIITGRGNGFSVGADLKELPIESVGGELDLGKSLRENFEPMVLGFKKLPFPTIAAVNGYAAGAGMGLMLGCDFTICASKAQLVQAFINIALIPDAGSTYFLPRLIGRAKSTELMMLGENVSAQDALKMGMIYKVVDDENLMREAHILAEKLSRKPTSALILIRDLLDKSQENTLINQLSAEADAQKQAGKHGNFEEGVKAFAEKREPNFK
ncbi:MAG: enoyl-CoA hydratase-related protein [Emcibacteraceae bacterium]|nr:enoyl-CoA hydratase-related protein [Emcibacteraceae bacterium]